MFGQLGSTIQEALSTEFFHWFHLEKTGGSQDGDLAYQTYQPTAPQFHDLVQVTLTADRAESLKNVQLSIQRSFVDDPEHHTLATDIAKSFLNAALNPDDAGMMGTAMLQIRKYKPAASRMLNKSVAAAAPGGGQPSGDDAFEEIKQAIEAGRPVYLTTKQFKMEGGNMVPVDPPEYVAPLPGEGEPAYLTYSGKRRQLEQKLRHSVLRMVNGSRNGSEQLIISVSPL